MNARVTTDTWLALRRLDVLWHSSQGRCGVERRQVALQADCVHIGLNQQIVIRSSVREVAGTTTFSKDCRVLINEGTGCCGMAFGANHELPSSRRKRILAKDAMHIVAVCAVDQTLFYLVVRGHGELRLDVSVALEAELGLLHLEQMLRRAGSMDGVAADAAYIALAVGRTLEVARPAMACLTFFIHLFGRDRGWIEDRGSSAAIHVCFAGAMTAFAGHAITAMRQRRPAVRIFNKVLHDLLVTRRAGGCALTVV